jgi:UDP-glucose 4-epimerase
VHADKYLSDKEPCHHKFNLGTETGTSVKEIVDIFNHLCSRVETRVGLRREGDPPFLVANPNKFIKTTGFQYQYKNSDIDLMIKSAWEYRNGVRGK